MNRITAVFLFIMLFGDSLVAQTLKSRRIWNTAPHSAFTDIKHFNGKFYIAFREGENHVSDSGSIRLISSVDGRQWTTVKVFKDKTGDLRDAKMAILPGNILLLTSAVASANRTVHESKKWVSADGEHWSEGSQIGLRNYWLWGVVVNDTAVYSVGYPTGFTNATRPPSRLFGSGPSLDFSPVTDSVGRGSETALCFVRPDQCVAIKRRDPENALIGISKFPFVDWKWYDAGYRIGGQQIIMMPDGKILGGGRFYDGGKEHTALFYLNPNTKTIQKFAELPSGGDNGYPGLTVVNDTLWISYYSSHEGKASIYFSSIPEAVVTDTAPTSFVPSSFEFMQNYPNPFNPVTRLRYVLPFDGTVRMTVFNALGQQVAVIMDGPALSGENDIEWNAAGFASGTYLVQIEAVSGADPTVSHRETRKMMLTK